jgi:hypothetical protein
MTAPRTFPVEAGHVLMFARSVGDPNPVYADPDSPEARAVDGVIAPPTFVQASAQFDPDYPLRPKIGQPWFGSGREPSGRAARSASTDGDGDSPRGTGLHAEQHYEYHRTPRVGDVLSVTTRPGRRWEKQGRRAGKLVFSETITEYRDQSGELVVTARSVGVMTERTVEGE